VLSAALLAAEGVRFFVVGSAALWLHGVRVPVGDLDVVPETDEDNLDRLCGAVSQYWYPSRVRPSSRTVAAVDIWPAATFYGRVDVMVERARMEGAVLKAGAGPIWVADVEAMVASLGDVWELRRRFRNDHLVAGCR
jgi:hypothetical protein